MLLFSLHLQNIFIGCIYWREFKNKIKCIRTTNSSVCNVHVLIHIGLTNYIIWSCSMFIWIQFRIWKRKKKYKMTHWHDTFIKSPVSERASIHWVCKHIRECENMYFWVRTPGCHSTCTIYFSSLHLLNKRVSKQSQQRQDCNKKDQAWTIRQNGRITYDSHQFRIHLNGTTHLQN